MELELKELMNRQINLELYSAYLYLSLAQYFDREALCGFAHWFRKQAGEELEHGLRIFDHMLLRSESVDLSSVDAPSEVFLSYEDAVNRAYCHEKYVTQAIEAIYDKAIMLNDYKTQRMLDYFIVEQAEEEKTMELLLDRVRLYRKSSESLYMLDKELSMRTD